MEYAPENQSFLINFSRQLTAVFLYFKEFEVEKMKKRKEVYTFTSDFLAVCGGLLGLFLGVSVLSIFEIIYFSTLRVFWYIRMAEQWLKMWLSRLIRQKMNVHQKRFFIPNQVNDSRT